jgi:hypothetical protein
VAMVELIDRSGLASERGRFNVAVGGTRIPTTTIVPEQLLLTGVAVEKVPFGLNEAEFGG